MMRDFELAAILWGLLATELLMMAHLVKMLVEVAA
jgi:hypothetical protein